MSDPKIDAVLREFLSTWKIDQEAGHTIANLLHEISTLRAEVHELRILSASLERDLEREKRLLTMRVDRHDKRLLDIERRLAMQNEDVDTGQHQVDDLRRLLAEREREIDERKEEGRWWRRSGIQWIVAGAAWLVATIVSVIIATLVRR